jgi:GDP-L-fucose synthase
MKLANTKILLTGGGGFLGGFVYKQLLKNSADKKNIFSVTRSKLDLRKQENCEKAVKGMDLVIHLAANVGGIGYNRERPGELFYDNAIMGINMIHAAKKFGVNKFVQIGTVCSYPKFCKVPFKESDFWDGYPEETNAAYGLSKKMLLVMAQAYRQQYRMNIIYLIPVNLYGPGDNFDPKSSHVIPALIKRFVEAKKNKQDKVQVWGTGKATREFLYVEDAARGIVQAAMKYDKPDTVNIGSSQEISIKDLAEKIKDLVGYKGNIVWDKSKPDGQPRRKLDVSRAKEEFGFESKVGFDQGLTKTVKWYLCNH